MTVLVRCFAWPLQCLIVLYAQQGRGKRRRGAPEEPFLRLLLVRQGLPGGSQMGVCVEHHVHLSLPDFIITRLVHLNKPGDDLCQVIS